MIARYEVRPQRWNERYRRDEGWAVWDTRPAQQVGWFAHKERAQESAEQLNADPLTPEGVTIPAD